MNGKVSNVKANYMYQILYQILISVLPFITSPYVSRVFGANGLGAYTYSYSIVTYFKMFAALGIASYGNREIAKVKDDKERLNQTFSSLFALHGILSASTIIIYLIYLNQFVRENRVIALIQIFCLLGEMLDINWFYFGMEQFRLTVIRNSVVKISTVAAVFIFVHKPEDIWIYALIMAAGECISTSVVWVFLPKYARLVKFPPKEMAGHLKPMMVLFFSVIATSVYGYMDRIMLGAVSSMEEVAYYENALKMIIFPVGFITALGTVMLPKISNLIVKSDREAISRYLNESMRFSMIAAMAVSFGIAGIAKEFSVVFWGKDFADSGTLMTVLSATIILMAWNSVIRSQFLIPHAHDKVYLLAVGIGAAVNVGINFMLIPIYGAMGAAVGTIAAYGIIFCVQTLYAAKYLPVFRYMAQSLPYTVIGFIMFTAVRGIGNSMGYSVLTLVVEVIAGMVVFGALALLYAAVFKDAFVLQRCKQLKNMLLRRLK